MEGGWTVEVRFGAPSDLLTAMESHEIAEEDVLSRCDFFTGNVPRFTEMETLIEMERGLGGQVTMHGDGRKHIFGWTTAEALCEHHLGYNPARNLMGRANSFRACLEALVMAGR